MPIQLNSQQLSTLAKADFGDSPLGRIGNRNVTLGAGATPRAASLGIAQRVQESFSRLLNVVAPNDSRASSTVRAAVRDMSRELGNGLGALTPDANHQIDSSRFARMLGDLHAAAQPAIERGAEFDQLLNDRLTQHLSHAGLKDLLALREGLALAKQDPALRDIKPELDKFGAALESKLGKELELRLRQAAEQISTRFFHASEKAHGLPADQARDLASSTMTQAFNDAKALLISHGFRNSDATPENAQLTYGLIRSQISARPDNVQALLPHLSSEDLKRLADATPLRHSTPLANAMLRVEIESRTTQLESAAAPLLEALAAHPGDASADPKGPLHAPADFADELLTVAKAVSDLREHCMLHGQPISAALTDKLSRANNKAEGLLQSPAIDLNTYADATLGQLRSACKKMGLPGAEAAVTRQIALRNEMHAERYCGAFESMIRELTHQDATRTAAAFKRLTELGDTAMHAAVKMGEKYEGGDGAANFHRSLMHKGLALLPQPELHSLGMALASKTTRDVADTLRDLGMQLPADNLDLMRSMLGTASSIDTLSQEIADRLAPADAEQIHAALARSGGVKSAAASDATERLFGVKQGPGETAILTRGAVNRAFVGSMQSKLDELVIKPDPVKSPGDGLPAISEQFLVDLGRSSHIVNGRELAPRGQLSDVQRQAATRSLSDFVRGDERMLKLVADFANQKLPLLTVAPMLSGHSPFVLDDGSRGMPSGGHNPTTFTLTRNANDDILIHVSYEMSAPNHMQVPDENGVRMVILKPDSSNAEVSFSLRIDKNYEVDLDGDVQFSHHLAIDNWTKPYSRPSTLDDVIGNADALADFREACRSGFAENELNAFLAVRQLQTHVAPPAAEMSLAVADTLLSGAQDLFNRYVREGSDGQANVNSLANAAMADAINHVRAVFNDVEAQVMRLADNEYQPRYQSRMPQPAPKTVVEALADPASRSALRAAMAHFRATEQMDFLDALTAYKRTPSFAAAEKIASDFIRTDAPQLLNLDDSTASNLDQALVNARRQLNDEMRAALQTVDRDLKATLQDDVMNRWLRQIDAA